MEHSFAIEYHHDNIQVSQQDEHHFTVQLRDKEIPLFLKQDNEGANHWFTGEDSTEETPLTKELGELIEKALHV